MIKLFNYNNFKTIYLIVIPYHFVWTKKQPIELQERKEVTNFVLKPFIFGIHLFMESTFLVVLNITEQYVHI